MSFTRSADGTRLHFRVFGRPDGEPLLMLQGLGTDSRGWVMQQHAFGARYHCIAVDNRGVGMSDKPPGPYDLDVMAADAVAVLDGAGVESAHVMGASMGGVLAQILAVRHPERVRSLVLACTACRHLPWRRQLLEEWMARAESEGMRSFAQHELRWLLGQRSLRRIWPLLAIVGPLLLNTPAPSFVAQVQAILNMDDNVRDGLCEIAVPTLVTCGSQDILTPIGDSQELASLIPGAELAVVRGAAHVFMVEHSGTFNRTVLAFLDRVTDDAAGELEAA
jgi:3-oxoadipate enol-lactonase